MQLEGKRVLVTGAGGFIGSHLVERLLEEGCAVRAFVRYNSLGRRGWLDTLDPATQARLEFFAGDIRDPNGVRESMKGIEVVFHLAALIAIPYSYHSPDSYVDTNIRGTLNILQAGRDVGVERILVTSTSEVYGTARYVPIDEHHPRQPQSPYSATKIGADALADSFYRAFDLPLVIVRPFNTYGPRQSARAVIPTIITQLLAAVDVLKLGDPTPTRDFNFVRDTADGFIAIAKTDAALGHELNIANGDDVSIGDLAQKLIDRINPKVRIALDEQRLRPAKSEVERLLGSAEKLRGLSGWSPRRTLDEGLDETIAWFRKADNMRLYRPHDYNV